MKTSQLTAFKFSLVNTKFIRD